MSIKTEVYFTRVGLILLILIPITLMCWGGYKTYNHSRTTNIDVKIWTPEQASFLNDEAPGPARLNDGEMTKHKFDQLTDQANAISFTEYQRRFGYGTYHYLSMCSCGSMLKYGTFEHGVPYTTETKLPVNLNGLTVIQGSLSGEFLHLKTTPSWCSIIRKTLVWCIYGLIIDLITVILILGISSYRDYRMEKSCPRYS